MLNSDTGIVFDADVLKHFYIGGQFLLLKKLFKNRIYVPDLVFKEIGTLKDIKQIADNIVLYKIGELLHLKGGTEMKEYASLTRKLGRGESSCLVLARFRKCIVASSNLKDIREYCNVNKIPYLTTMDILNHAYNCGELSEAECDFFIYEVKSKGSKLPCDSIKEFREVHLQ